MASQMHAQNTPPAGRPNVMFVRDEIAAEVLKKWEDDRAMFDMYPGSPHCADASRGLTRMIDSVEAGDPVNIDSPLFPSDAMIPEFVNVAMYVRSRAGDSRSLATLAADMEEQCGPDCS